MATRKHMDFVGLFAVGFAVSFGGGTLRDLFLDRHPLFWIANPHYPMLVFGLALIGSLVPRQIEKLERFTSFPDALGLGNVSRFWERRLRMNRGSHRSLAVLIGVIARDSGVSVERLFATSFVPLSPCPLVCHLFLLQGAVLYVAAERFLPGNHWVKWWGRRSSLPFRLGCHLPGTPSCCPHVPRE
ncbi:MAG: TRIC cation channel family protein [Planctomycetaceae bacterium]